MSPRLGATTEERRALWRQLEENQEATLKEHRGLWECAVLLQSRDDEPRNPQARVDLQAKAMAASECDEVVCAAWRERAAGIRPQAARVRGRVRLERRTCTAARQGTQGGTGPRQEHTTLLASMGSSGMGPCLAVGGWRNQAGVRVLRGARTRSTHRGGRHSHPYLLLEVIAVL
jgi:hypothetical protein